MTWVLSVVPTEAVKTLWPRVAPMLARAVPYSGGRFTLKDVFENLCSQKQLLWVTYDDVDNEIAAVFTTRQAQYAKKAMLVIECAGGSRMRQWLRVASATFRAYARDAGLEGIEMYGRPGWSRVLRSCGWQQKLVVMEISAAGAGEV
jgi:hypothetical protein